jgi:hypothetical protein
LGSSPAIALTKDESSHTAQSHVFPQSYKVNQLGAETFSDVYYPLSLDQYP